MSTTPPATPPSTPPPSNPHNPSFASRFVGGMPAATASEHGAARPVSGSTAPHVCPICLGKGKVPASFYGEDVTSGVAAVTRTTMCLACNGTGIVWEPRG